MPRCYIFATVAIDDERRPPDRLREEVNELAKTRMKELSESNKARTTNHLCAELKGDFQFLLRFDYRTLFDVATAVLDNRLLFCNQLSRTLTVLEYPDNKTTLNRVVTDPFAETFTRGILLLQEKMGTGSFGTAQVVKKELETVLGPSTIVGCLDVFGPYDYLVEFTAVEPSDVDDVMKELQRAKELWRRGVRWTGMHCAPYEFGGGRAGEQLSLPLRFQPR
ncbi:hypothetical protein [Paraburkholderia sp. 40]|uniref:hypothetical protein n=1 Tax=Paraburkholderia sp. 40 TaxID=2991059 RepID=UPI003D1D12D1